jgi:hypothetical protein
MINEATRRIAEQAFSFAYVECKKMGRKGGEGDHIWVTLAMGKQYELIVNECAAYLNGAMEVHNQAEQDLCDHAARKIKEHFGVE